MKPPNPTQGAVTASSAAAVDAGLGILRQGGNAIDAAVATALASCVADPCNTGLGGYGGHMVVVPQDGPAHCIDFNMWNPGDISDTELMRPYPNHGPRASCVPNVVAGLSRALAAHGKLDWATISIPAIELARAGVPCNGTTRLAFADAEGAPFLQECFEFDHRADASVFRQPLLANTLEQLAERGPDWLYGGPLAELAAGAWHAAGIEQPAERWRSAPDAVRMLPAAKAVIADQILYTPPYATSGAACALGTLAAGARLLAVGAPESPEQLTAWAERIAALWSYRFGHEHGNDFDRQTIDDWLAAALAASPGGPSNPNHGHTCHLNTMDATGTLVAVTLTHGPFWFGGRWALPGTGIIMNAGMHLFSNVAPVRIGKRAYAVTNMAPAVVRTRDGASLAIGCPGARRIPTHIGLVLARHLFGGLSLQAAVSAGRFHAESLDRVDFESDRLDSRLKDALGTRFRQVEQQEVAGYYGPLTALRRTPEKSVEFGLDDRVFSGYGAMLEPSGSSPESNASG